MIVLDTEFTGDDVLRNAMIELGAVLIKNSTSQIIDFKNFVINIPPGRIWNSTTRNWMLQSQPTIELVEQIDKNEGIDLIDAMNQFVIFIKNCYQITNGDIIIGSDHIGIDNSWISVYLSIAGYLPLHKLFGTIDHQIDISSYHQGCARITHQQVKKWNKENDYKFSSNIAVLNYFNVKKPKIKYSHRAWMDAKFTAIIHSKILKTIENYWKRR